METLSVIWHGYRSKMFDLPIDWIAKEIDSTPTALTQMFDRKHRTFYDGGPLRGPYKASKERELGISLLGQISCSIY
jgi:hypothetical protein